MFEFDPFNPTYFADPWPYYREMRANHPVYRHDSPQQRVWPHYWMLSRAGDVEEALGDWRTFSSARGTLIDTDISLLPPNIFNMDPPRHDELRSLLVRVLTRKRVAGLESHVRTAAHSLVDKFRSDSSFDASVQYGQQIPTLTMCALMDLPVGDREKFLEWNLATIGGADFTSPEALKAYADMGAYWTDLVAYRRRHPGDDLISQMLHTEVKGEDLSDEEIGGFCSLLHDASQNTTMNMITHSVVVFGSHPDQWAKVTREPDLWPPAIEELLRWVSPVQGLARTATRDVELHGVTIPAGDQVLMLYGSANHDESIYPEPDVFDVERPSTKAHFAFGHGIHYCLGNSVARLEIQVALQVLMEVFGTWHADPADMELNQLVPTRGVARAPVSI